MIGLDQVAMELGVSYWTVLRYIKAGDLKAIRLPGGRYRIEKREVQRFKSRNVVNVAGDLPA